MPLQSKTIYLCGPIKDRSDADCIDWREAAKKLWPGPTLDPMRRDYRLAMEQAVKDGKQRELAAEIVAYDRADIEQSDGLLVWFDGPSVGTSMEIFYAHSLGKPIVLIDRTGPALSPWIVHHISRVTNNLRDGITLLSELI